jgi:hypothetical protein
LFGEGEGFGTPLKSASNNVYILLSYVFKSWTKIWRGVKSLTIPLDTVLNASNKRDNIGIRIK